jgi:hypothetical protein
MLSYEPITSRDNLKCPALYHVTISLPYILIVTQEILPFWNLENCHSASNQTKTSLLFSREMLIFFVESIKFTLSMSVWNGNASFQISFLNNLSFVPSHWYLVLQMNGSTRYEAQYRMRSRLSSWDARGALKPGIHDASFASKSPFKFFDRVYHTRNLN